MEDKIVRTIAEKKLSLGNWLHQNIYYFVIGFGSLIVLILFPLISAESSLEIFPSNTSGWIWYIVEKMLVIGLNCSIFASFRGQAKLNVKDNPNFITANKLLQSIKGTNYYKEKIPRSPKQWARQQWRNKGITMILTTLVTSFAVSNIILQYDWLSLIAYVITLGIGIVFGVLQMCSEEAFWTEEYLDYANYMVNKNKMGDDNVTI